MANSKTGVLYASTWLKGEHGFRLLQGAVDALLSTIDVSSRPTIPWSMQFGQRTSVPVAETSSADDHVLRFPPPSLDLVFEEKTLDRVKAIWQKIMGDGAEVEQFLVFPERDGAGDQDQEDDE